MADQTTDLRCYLTDSGIIAENLATSKGLPLPVKELVFGSGLLDDDKDPSKQTTLLHEEATAPCALFYDPDNPKKVTFKADLKADIGGFYINEIAVRLENGELYGYARGTGDYKPIAEQGSTDSSRYAVDMYTDNADIIECVIDMSHISVDFDDLHAAFRAHEEADNPHSQYLLKDDESVTNARDWDAEIIPKTEAEAGESNTPRKWTALRVLQAIKAWAAKNLGTAASRDVMTSATDMETPNALMPRGAFGVGDFAFLTNLGGSNITTWSLVAKLRGVFASQGSAISFDIFGGTSIGSLHRSRLSVLAAQRGSNGINVQVYKLGTPEARIGYVQVGEFDFDIYVQRIAWAHMTVTGGNGFGSELVKNLVNLTEEPEGIVYVAPNDILHRGNTGDAVTKNVMKSPTDLDTPDALMIRGAFGVGEFHFRNLNNNGNQERFYKVATLRGLASSIGAYVSFDLIGSGNYGALGRESLHINAAQRGVNGVKLDIYEVSNGSVLGGLQVGYVRVDEFSFDIYVKQPIYNPFSIQGADSYLGGRVIKDLVPEIVEPTSIVYVSKTKLYHSGNLPTATESDAASTSDSIKAWSPQRIRQAIDARIPNTSEAVNSYCFCIHNQEAGLSPTIGQLISAARLMRCNAAGTAIATTGGTWRLMTPISINSNNPAERVGLFVRVN